MTDATDQCGDRKIAGGVVEPCELLVEGTAVRKPGQRIGVGDPLVLVEFAADLVHLLRMLGHRLHRPLPMGHLAACCVREKIDGAANDVGRNAGLGVDAGGGLTQQLRIAFHRTLLLSKQGQKGFELPDQLAMHPFDDLDLMRPQKFRRQGVQFLLAGIDSESRPLLGQRAIGSDVGFVEQLVVPGDRGDTHRP